jgi:hypothetical protein
MAHDLRGERRRNYELVKKHGKAPISALRKSFGKSFAPGMPDDEKLVDVIDQLDERSLLKLAADRARA